jgi:hypothetical protein
VRLIKERNNKYKEINRQSLTNKLSDKREKFELSHEKFLVKRKLEEDLRDEKIFKRYQGYVSILFFIALFIFIVLYYER